MLAVLAEKYAIAKILADALLDPGFESRPSGFWGAMSGTRVVIVYADGHLCEFAEPATYNPAWGDDWRLDVLPMAPAGFQFRLVPRRGEKVAELLEGINAVFLRADQVVNACDAGMEGELIFHTIAQVTGLYDRSVPMGRIWISDTTQEGVRKAWMEMRDHFDPMVARARSQAVTRAEANWIWNLNLTRYATCCLRGKAPVRLACGYVSVGRVRTPLMGVVSERCKDIAYHEPQHYLRAYLTFRNEEGKCCEATLLAPPMFQFGTRNIDWRDDAKIELEARLWHISINRDSPWTVIEGAKNRDAYEYPPDLFSLTDLQRTANRLMGWTAKRTERVAQSLYAKHKAISYPRTDCCKVPTGMRESVRACWADLWHHWLPRRGSDAFEGLPKWSLDDLDWERHFVDAVDDHYAIIPTGIVPRVEIEGKVSDEYFLWDLIARRFLGAWLPPAIVFASSRVFQLPYAPGEILRALITAAPVKDSGWLVFEDLIGTTRGFEQKLASRLQEELLPPMPSGKATFLRDRRMRRVTTPPEYHTYDSILAAMEKLHLGTAATQASIIQELIDVNYIAETNTGRLITTLEGEAILELLAQYGGQAVVDRNLARFWEEEIARVGRKGPSGRKRLEVLRNIYDQVIAIGGNLQGPTDAEQLVFCPKMGIRIKEVEEGWVFPGWKDVVCKREMWGRTMKPSEYRDVFQGGRSGSGPFEGFYSPRSGENYSAWLIFDTKSRRFNLSFKRGKRAR